MRDARCESGERLFAGHDGGPMTGRGTSYCAAPIELPSSAGLNQLPLDFKLKTKLNGASAAQWP
jgi:hypothetical protein